MILVAPLPASTARVLLLLLDFLNDLVECLDDFFFDLLRLLAASAERQPTFHIEHLFRDFAKCSVFELFKIMPDMTLEG